jgi:hypothetical protein
MGAPPRPVYNPGEGRLTYTAQPLGPNSSNIELAQGAVNKLLEQYGPSGRALDNAAPRILSPADLHEGLELSEVSLFIDAAFTPSTKPSRRWLQVRRCLPRPGWSATTFPRDW